MASATVALPKPEPIQSPALAFASPRSSPMRRRTNIERRPSSIHPLEDTPESDSEVESACELSYTESITSMASADSSCACSPSSSCYSTSSLSLRPSASPPLVAKLFISVCSSPAASEPRTKSALTQLLQDSNSPRLLAASIESHAAWQLFLSLPLGLLGKGASGKDRGATAIMPSEHVHSKSHEEELQTFFETPLDAFEAAFSTTRARNREFRINSEFLRRYALDNTARVNGVLPFDIDDVRFMLQRKPLRDFDRKHGIMKYSELSRDKLWNSVILPPRSDPCPKCVIDCDQYSMCHDNHSSCSIITKHSQYIPWAAQYSSIRPAGELRTSKSIKSKVSPNLGSSKPQYTVKGWQSDRWVSIS